MQTIDFITQYKWVKLFIGDVDAERDDIINAAAAVKDGNNVCELVFDRCAELFSQRFEGTEANCSPAEHNLMQDMIHAHGLRLATDAVEAWLKRNQ